jgi:minor extracellular serine protease Vpr
MPRLISLMALCSAMVFLFLPQSVSAAPPAPQIAHVMIELNGSPAAGDANLKDRSGPTHFRLRFDPYSSASRQYEQKLNRYQDQEVAYLRSRGIDLSIQQRFNLLFNGFTASLPKTQLASLRGLSNVAGLAPVARPYPLLDRSIPLVNAPAAWAVLGGAPNAGRGLMIAEIDTGVDVNHSCFRDAGFTAPPAGRRSDTQQNRALTNNKVIVARAFGGPDPHISYSAADHMGHGTFGAAIEACDYNTPTPLGTTITGMAPAAYIGNYNIFPQNADQSGNYDPVIDAMQAALLDGMDVINMSIGLSLGAGDLSLDPDMLAVQTATKAGIPVVVSAGNAGPTAQSVSSPAAAPDAIAVGAVTNSHGIHASISIDGPAPVPANLSDIVAGLSTYQWKGPVGPSQMVFVGLGRKPHNAGSSAPSADDFAGKDLHGKIAVIQRGEITFQLKVDNAQAEGAVGAIIFDNRPEIGVQNISTPTATLPTTFISQASGQALLSWIQQHPDATVSMDSTPRVVEETPDLLSDFSSVGYGADYAIKPDLVGPGQDIYSATESQFLPGGDQGEGEMYSANGFISEDGTSFSAPHVTGAVALLLQKHPKWTPAMIKSALMDTAARDVYTDPSKSQQASVLQDGAGMLDAGAAVKSTAYLSPSSLSFGAVNAGYGTVQRSQTLTLNDAGSGGGTWQVSLSSFHQTPGLTVSVPSSVSLSSGGQATLSVSISATGSVQTGDYDGDVVLTQNGETLHVPYFVHLVNQPVKTGSVLLIDDTTSRFVSPIPGQTVPHRDVTKWYEHTLNNLKRSYTYWNEATLGTPTLADMKRASSVIFFTADNLNAFSPINQNSEALMPPMGPSDYTTLKQYLDGGGRLFLTGLAAALLDANGGLWTALEFGAESVTPSVYDNEINDNIHAGKISPTRPSAFPVSAKRQPKNAGIFDGLKPVDISTKGNGARDNLAVYNQVLAAATPVGNGMIGVSGLTTISGAQFGFHFYGRPALQAKTPAIVGTPVDIATTSSDEPSFGHSLSYHGRSVLFSFAFEGINDNTGYATREQVMSRILKWFSDQPAARVTSSKFASGRSVHLAASFHANAKAAQYVWQVGSRTLDATSRPTSYRFGHPGTYRIRVQITDALGHRAVSPWKNVKVRK